MFATYDQLGSTYRTSRAADPGIVSKLRELLRVDFQGRYLDIGCGTGNYTAALAAIGGAWHGVDPSEVMLSQAKALSGQVRWHQASAGALPFADGVFDGAVCTNAIHHFDDLVRAFSEVRRVMRAGRFVIFSGLAEQTGGYWLCHYFPQMMRRSVEITPSEAAIRSALDVAGFASTEVLPFFVTGELCDLFLYSGKDRPQLYLRNDVRANITSFAHLCPPDELARGLAQLSADIRSGTFGDIRARYRDDAGDYAYVVATVHATEPLIRNLHR
jgi:ubiquinone/menaquinone biosynthesis C-methylase UbiE